MFRSPPIWREGCYVSNVNKVYYYNRLYGIMTVPQDPPHKRRIRAGGCFFQLCWMCQGIGALFAL
jgi:hypothetical protein